MLSENEGENQMWAQKWADEFRKKFGRVPTEEDLIEELLKLGIEPQIDQETGRTYYTRNQFFGEKE